jgi:hypothetical protein
MNFIKHFTITLAHMIPIELFFAVLTITYPAYEKAILFINYDYGIIVIMVWAHWTYIRILPIWQKIVFLLNNWQKIEALLKCIKVK